MFHENLEKGPTYYVREDFHDDAKKLNFAEFLEKKMLLPVPISIKILFIILSLGIVCLFTYQTLIISFDVILSLGRLKRSTLYQFNISDVSFTLVILYYLQPLFITITTILVLVGLYGALKRGIIARKILNPDQQYLINTITSISADNPSLLNKFIKYGEKENKYRLIGFFSSFDPFRCYSGMITSLFSTLIRSIVASFWILATGFVNISILFLIDIPRTEQLEQLTNVGLLVSVLGLGFFILYGSQFIEDFRKFLSFLNELITKQEEYILHLIVKLKTPQNTNQELFLEKQLADKDYLYYNSLKNLPKKYLLRASTALIPIGFSILSLIL